MSETGETKIVYPDDNGYDETVGMVQSRINQNKRRNLSYFDYDLFAHAYNQSPMGSVVIPPSEATKNRGNMARILVRRDLVEGEDFAVVKPTRDGRGEMISPRRRSLYVHKLTQAKMRIIRDDN